MTAAQYKADIELTKATPYIALTGELYGVCRKDFGENWPHFSDTVLFVLFQLHAFENVVYKK